MAEQYRMPAEWEPHAATWLVWPTKLGDWPGKYAPIPWVYGEIVRTLARTERVNIVVPDAKVQAKAAKVVADAHADLKNVRWHTTPTNRSWARDSGPIFVTNSAGKLRALDWKFSAWAKYPDWQIDDQLPNFIATTTKTPRVEPIVKKTHVVLEGG
ncbi:MAG: agmatine deiminase family protein, partial [Gemmataceae bacterium]